VKIANTFLIFLLVCVGAQAAEQEVYPVVWPEESVDQKFYPVVWSKEPVKAEESILGSVPAFYPVPGVAGCQYRGWWPPAPPVINIGHGPERRILPLGQGYYSVCGRGCGRGSVCNQWPCLFFLCNCLLWQFFLYLGSFPCEAW